jgi:peptide/nickel transport system substrate-binding protein
MNWKRFDSLRQDSGAIELDLIEAYAQRRIDRRNFVKRGTIVGLSMPFMASVIAACGDSDSTDDGGGGSSTNNNGFTQSTGTKGGTLIVAQQEGDANTGLDPVAMLDLGTYNVCSQQFEYLVGVGSDGNITNNALATDWSPNDDGTVWTFTLREGVQWSDGNPFTSADVAATLDRLAEAGNAGLGGVIDVGSTETPDDLTAVVTLIDANGNFPVLVSTFNAQALITPADYSSGTTLDERAVGTGAWILDDFDSASFVARFSPNPNWWGGEVNLEGLELQGFADIATAVVAMSARQVDVVQQFSVLGGEGLIADESFTVLTPPASNHRQVWFNVRDGQFTDNRVRQALAYTLDRDQMVSTLFNGRAEVANDHPVLSSLPFFDEDATPQRTRDIDKAKSLLSDAGVEEITAEIHVGNLQEIPDLADIIVGNAQEAGFNLTVAQQDNDTFYGDSWCPEGGEGDMPCPGSDELGIVDYGHRPVPDIFFSSALATGGVWNSSNYANADFDAQLLAYRTAVDVDGQKAAVGEIQKILHEDTPACYPYFFNYLGGHDDGVSGVQITSLGHVITTKASKEA